MTFRFTDPTRALSGVALAHELRRPRRVQFRRGQRRGTWQLDFRLPDVNRMEYLLELTRAGTSRGSSPIRPTRSARRACSARSRSSSCPTYEPPDWVADDESPPGEVSELEVPVAALGTSRCSSGRRPTPTRRSRCRCCIAHDGPEYAELARLIRFLDHAVSFGEVPPHARRARPAGRPQRDLLGLGPLRAGVRPGALPRSTEALPTNGAPAVMGASLGGLAALHAHWQHGARGALPAVVELLPRALGQAGVRVRPLRPHRALRRPRPARRRRAAPRAGDDHGRPRPRRTSTTTAPSRRRSTRRAGTCGWSGRDAHNCIAWRDLLARSSRRSCCGRGHDGTHPAHPFTHPCAFWP